MITTWNETSGLKAKLGLMKPKRGAISAPVRVMNIAETTNIVTLANGTLTPTWRATVSSSPITRSARPSRVRRNRQPTKNTITARASRCS